MIESANDLRSSTNEERILRDANAKIMHHESVSVVQTSLTSGYGSLFDLALCQFIFTAKKCYEVHLH